MLQTGKMKEITNKLIKWNIQIMALQATQTEWERMDDKYTLLYSAEKRKESKNVTAFVVLKKRLANYNGI
jgi:hypothetical protein